MRAFLAIFATTVTLTALAALFTTLPARISFPAFSPSPSYAAEVTDTAQRVTLKISDWKSGEIYREVETKIGGRLFFGWIHSQENIPWNEYFHIDENCDLILDAITFPAFGAGIPENKGNVCYIKDGLIHMEEIGQRFEELAWLNSHTATRDIRIDGDLVAAGSDLPQHTRLRLLIERGDADEPKH